MFLPEFQKSGSKNRTPIFSRLYILSIGTKPSNQISFKQRRIYSINELISQKQAAMCGDWKSRKNVKFRIKAKLFNINWINWINWIK